MCSGVYNSICASIPVPQAERFVDRKLDQAESALKKKQHRVKKWYSALIGDEHGARLNELHIFAVAFGAGVFLGFASS